jgi:hypothetical protein
MFSEGREIKYRDLREFIKSNHGLEIMFTDQGIWISIRSVSIQKHSLGNLIPK